MHKKLLVSLAMIVIAPAQADVKAGIDAWAKGDFKRAVQQWRGPAAAGIADAQFNLGLAYKLGRGVPVDPRLAEDWFHKAALQGHAPAGDNYALALFQSGRRAEALPWLEKSAARGDERCQLVLGTMLFNGDGGPRDYPRAYALMTRATAAGLPTAAETLAQIDRYITAADRERGTRLAQQYAADAALRPAAPPTPIAAEPPAGGTLASKAMTPAADPTPRPRPRLNPIDKGVGVSIAMTMPMPMMVGAGGWAIQLGAFRSRANAEAMWERMKGKLPGAQAFYRDGDIIRVFASGYADKAAAQAACTKAGVPCILIAP